MSEPLPIEQRVSRRNALRERVAGEILAAAADVLVGAGEASMHDVATAAGIARGTLYRYFPSRQVLVERLRAVATEQTSERLRAARVREVEPLDGLERAIRVLVEGGNGLVIAARERTRTPSADFESAVVAPLRELLERGGRDNVIRADMDAAWLSECLLGLVVAARSADSLGRDDMVAAIKRLFLEGARPR